MNAVKYSDESLEHFLNCIDCGDLGSTPDADDVTELINDLRETRVDRDRWIERAKKIEAKRDKWRQRFGDGIDHEAQKLVEFADLAKRIAKADAKHPRDADDGNPSLAWHENILASTREHLRERPSWWLALECEVNEAIVECARRDHARLADELLDVATVAMRWRRAILERGER